MAKKVSRKEEEELKKLSPEERKAIKKQMKRYAYQKEKAQRKEERYQNCRELGYALEHYREQDEPL